MKFSIFLATLLALTGCAHRPQTPMPQPAPPIEIDLPATVPDTATPACKKLLPPVCPGGLLPADATIDQVNAYWTTYKMTVPLTCRFQAPPRCFTGQKSTCKDPCSP